MGEGDGVYYSGSAYSGSRSPAATDDRRSAARRAKKALVAVVGLSAVGGGAYFATTLLSGHPPGVITGGPGALAPVAPGYSTAPTTVSAPPASPSPGLLAGPSAGPLAGIKNGVPQSVRPSPTPSISDDQIAAAEVGRLLQASPQPASSGMAIASGPVTVTTETGTDGSSIRVVAARYDLTGRWSPLAAGDAGEVVGDAQCTRKLSAGPGQPAQDRPQMLMCWRTGPAKSVVTVAIRPQGEPLTGSSLDVLDRQWTELG